MELRLNYPVLLLSKSNNRIYVFTKEKDLKSTNEELFGKINYSNYYVVDELGLKYTINNAFKVKNCGLFGFNPFLKGKQILIDFEFSSQIDKLLLDTIKQELVQRIEQDKNYWKLNWNIQELEAKIISSKTFKEIYLLLK
ncbi:hypothetical protein [Myroides marinus]|uniref:hypothetical protein n=1 Tax=Myroides marinus TaxID=703342 RepID=UPI0025756F9A|nr:hypothetical protein [Myroides marinus]MDM1380730.1 hypothetical protein [Myroides marinus]MDM1388013.1 hypothetical protein [Myroides marinus]MDM1395225.1 hypothetical protein [Myroides marinus]